MTWILPALLGAFCLAIVHHLDKLILTRFALSYSVGSLVIFSSLFPALVLPVLLLITGTSAFVVPGAAIAMLIGVGILGSIGSLFYFHALEKEETTTVVSMYQLSPVFGYILGLTFLDEKLTAIQIMGAVVTVLGVTILSLEFSEERRIRFRTAVTGLMAIAALTYALSDVIYKGTTLGQLPYFVAMFWVFVGYVMFGIAVLAVVQSYRDKFMIILRGRGRAVLVFNMLNEIFQTGSLMFTSYALLLAPVALVLTMDSYQPVFVFALGILLTLFAPTLASERLSVRHLLHKATAITITVFGTLLMQA